MSPRRRTALHVAWVALVTHALVIGAFPRVFMSFALGRIEARAGVNHAWFAPRPDHTFRAIVRPSPDLLYAVCVLDLDAARGSIDVEATLPPPYGSLAFYDAETNVVEVLRDHDFAGGAVRARVVARGAADRHDGVRTIQLPSRRGLLLERVLIPNDAAIPALEAARRSLRCQPHAE
jgi:uncharacterized membrane protein